MSEQFSHHFEQVIKPQIIEFSKQLTSFVSELGIEQELRTLPLDHIAIEFGNPGAVDNLIKELENLGGRIIDTSLVNNRDIHIIKLTDPIDVAGWFVDILELPYPKQGRQYNDKPTHVEFVINCEAKTVSEMEETFKQTFPNLTTSETDSYVYQTDLPDVKSSQPPNPTLSISKNNITIKFHPKSIESLVTNRD